MAILVLQRALLNASSFAFAVFGYGVIRIVSHGYPQSPNRYPSSNAWLLSSLSCINEFVKTKLSCVEPGHLATTVKYNRMQIKNEIFDERCKVLHTELKVNTKVGTRLQCPERASLNANGRKCPFRETQQFSIGKKVD